MTDYKAKLEELETRHDDVQMSLELFELGERIKGNPAALAGRPPCKWGPLPPDIEALYDEQWELAQEIYIINEPSPETDYFGVCPYCDQWSGYINIGRSHWFYCSEHKVRWFVGSDHFGSWRYQTQAEQEAIFKELDFGSFRVIEVAWGLNFS